MPLFDTPATLLAFYDPYFQSGEFHLFPWQIGVHRDFAHRHQGQPRELLVVAPNGTGKSTMILAPQAIWTAMSYENSQTAITSSSLGQLDLQTMRACKRLAGYVNAYHKAQLWDMPGRHMEFYPHHSMIDARKSDEEGMQEGFHPLVQGGEFTILIDEAKSISEPIYNGILKWTGFTRRTDITSASDPSGVFFRNLCFGKQKKWVVKADDCPNFTEADKERILISSGGVDSPLARQILKSEWAALSGSVVITLQDVERCIRLGSQGAIEWRKEQFNNAGLDLSGGGDETVLSVWNGNKQLAIETSPFKKENQTEDHIAHILIPKWDLKLENIRVDAGGIGRPMLRNIQAKVIAKHGSRYGQQMRMTYNQSMPVGVLKANFGNKGTQLWYHFATLIQDCQLILMDDAQQKSQLCNRYYTQQKSSDKIILEPKLEARSKGHPSPDRADSAVLAKGDYTNTITAEPVAQRRKMSAEELQAYFEAIHEGQFDVTPKTGPVTIEHIVGMREIAAAKWN